MAFRRPESRALSCSIVVLFLVGLAAARVRAQVPPVDAVATRVDSLFARWDKSNSPGCALGISRDGAVVYQRGYGMASLEHGIAITPRTVFPAESITKQFTAMAVLLLAQRDQLSLDDEVRQYITELPDYGSPLTIRHLLTHTSGLRDVWALTGMVEPRDWRDWFDRDGASVYLRLLERQQALNSRPGTEYQYLNFGYWVLGYIVERVSGQSLDAFTDENILRPLGMTQSFRRDDYRVIVPNLVTGYALRMDGTPVLVRPMSLEEERSFGGHGGLHTTVGDLLIWEQNFANVRVGTPDLVAAMHTKWYPPGSETNFYGLGVRVGQYRGLPMVWHEGSGRGYQTFLIRYPDHGLAIALLCNLGPDSAPINREEIANRIADLYLEKAFPAPATSGLAVDSPAQTVSVEQAELAALAGTYWNSLRDRVLHFEMQNGELTLDGELLTPLGAGRFRLGARPYPLVFPPPRTGQAQEMHILTPGEVNVFSRVPVRSYSATDLRQFSGRYASTEIETEYTIEASEAELMIRIRNREDVRVRPIFEDAFGTGGSLLVRFMRDSQGLVTGFTVTTGLARRIRFVRVG